MKVGSGKLKYNYANRNIQTDFLEVCFFELWFDMFWLFSVCDLVSGKGFIDTNI